MTPIARLWETTKDILSPVLRPLMRPLEDWCERRRLLRIAELERLRGQLDRIRIAGEEP